MITLLSTNMAFAAAATSTTTTVDPATGTTIQSTTTNVDDSATTVTTPADTPVVDTTVSPNMEIVTPVDIDNNVQIVNDRVSITGLTTAPAFTTVELRDGVYYLPPAVTPVDGFYFLIVGDTERVCTVKKIKKVKKVRKISPMTTKVMIKNKKVTLYCYDRTYFNF
ncbi:hypothetical protein [Legionella busanensis]|uniref:hypothetical protein n=1 Tax=Legionella busanensis TaxID=190655 RepID=UPI001F5FAF65|nr:hypothetical protein [Legionella busanensis]